MHAVMRVISNDHARRRSTSNTRRLCYATIAGSKRITRWVSTFRVRVEGCRARLHAFTKTKKSSEEQASGVAIHLQKDGNYVQ